METMKEEPTSCAILAKGLHASRAAVLVDKNAKNLCFPRKKLNEIEKGLRTYGFICSSGPHAHSLSALRSLLESRFLYGRAVAVFSYWSRYASGALNSVLKLEPRHSDPEVAKGRCRILAAVLVKASEDIGKAADLYSESVSHMRVAIDNVVLLAGTLNSSFCPGNAYYEEQRCRIREGVSGVLGTVVAGSGTLSALIGSMAEGLVGSAVGGLCGMVFSFITASAMLRARTLTELETERKDVEEEYSSLLTSLELCASSTAAVDARLRGHLSTISIALQRLQDASFDDALDDAQFGEVREAMSELARECRESYRMYSVMINT